MTSAGAPHEVRRRWRGPAPPQQPWRGSGPRTGARATPCPRPQGGPRRGRALRGRQAAGPRGAPRRSPPSPTAPAQRPPQQPLSSKQPRRQQLPARRGLPRDACGPQHPCSVPGARHVILGARRRGPPPPPPLPFRRRCRCRLCRRRPQSPWTPRIAGTRRRGPGGRGPHAAAAAAPAAVRRQQGVPHHQRRGHVLLCPPQQARQQQWPAGFWSGRGPHAGCEPRAAACAPPALPPARGAPARVDEGGEVDGLRRENEEREGRADALAAPSSPQPGAAPRRGAERTRTAARSQRCRRRPCCGSRGGRRTQRACGSAGTRAPPPCSRTRTCTARTCTP